MTEKRKITREDALLKIRLLAEGVRYEVKGTSQWRPLQDVFTFNPNIVFDGCDLHAATRPNPHSPLEVIIDGSDVTISEMGEVLGTGTLEPLAPWRDKLMSDGTPVGDAFSGTIRSSNIVISNRCFTYDSGKGCKYCAQFAFPPGPLMSFSETLAVAERQVEATAIAVQSGWRGAIILVGGATPPWRRDQWTTDLFEAIMERFHKSLDDDILSQLAFAPSVYPPNDLGQLYKWKSFGITSPNFDSEVMDPDYFKAICPGRGEQKRWFEAQEAAVEVFGGCGSAVVAGIEPMAGMLKGIEERISKGVYIFPMIFQPMVGAPMAGMQPASAEWYLEAFQKIADIYSRYGVLPPYGAPPPFNPIDPLAPCVAEDLLHPGPDIERGPGMAITANTTIADVLKEKPNAREILAKHMGQPVDESRLSQGMGMSIQQVAGYIGWNQEKIDAFVKDLNES